MRNAGQPCGEVLWQKMKWLVWWLMPAAAPAQDYYLAPFGMGPAAPPRPMTLVLRDNASTNVTLAPGAGIVGGRARRGLVVDWFDVTFDGPNFAARTVLSLDRFADLDDAEPALARQFVFLDTLAIARAPRAAAEATPLRRIQAAGLDVNVIAEDPVVAVVKALRLAETNVPQCSHWRRKAVRGGGRRKRVLGPTTRPLASVAAWG